MTLTCAGVLSGITNTKAENMNIREADRLILSGHWVTMRDTFYGKTFVIKVIGRTRTTIDGLSDNGHVGTYERASLEIVGIKYLAE